MKRCKKRRMKRRVKTGMERRKWEVAVKGGCCVFKQTVSAVTAAERAEPRFPLSSRVRTCLRCSAIAELPTARRVSQNDGTRCLIGQMQRTDFHLLTCTPT